MGGEGGGEEGKRSEINVGWQKVDGERVLMGVWWTRPDRQW